MIVATLPASAGPALPLLIDGTHRRYKAHAEGTAGLPAYVRTAAETAPSAPPADPGRRGT